MRKCVWAVLLVVAMSRVAYGQTITAGVKAGIGWSSLPNAGQVIDRVVKQASTETSSKMGLLLDGFVTFPISDDLAFQPEMAFTVKGVTLTEAASGGTVSASLRYLEFPLLLRYNFAAGGHRAYALAGPTFDLKAGTSGRLDAPGQTTDLDVDAAVRTFDAGFTLAAGIESGRYLVEARYAQGILDAATDVFAHSDSLHNRVLAVVAGIRFK